MMYYLKVSVKIDGLYGLKMINFARLTVNNEKTTFHKCGGLEIIELHEHVCV